MKLTIKRALRGILWFLTLIVFGALLYLAIIFTDIPERTPPDNQEAPAINYSQQATYPNI